MNISVCVVSNMFFDKDYIVEWCEHYYELGFNFIYILEDLNGRDEKFIDMPYIADKVNNGKMFIEQIPHQDQYGTYPQFYEKHKTEFDWCAIFDSDEFLVLNNHKNIHEFLSQDIFDNADVVTINWKMFGDNGHLYKEDKPVVERFLNPAQQNDMMETKIIVRGNLSNTEFFIGHCCVANKNPKRTVFCDGTPYSKLYPFHKANYEIAALNHYYTKSTEEYIKRKSYGRLDLLTRSYKDALIDFMHTYFKWCERTPEKEKMFNDAINSMKGC